MLYLLASILTKVNLDLTGVRFHSTTVRLSLTAKRPSLNVVNLDLARVRFYSAGVRLSLTGVTAAVATNRMPLLPTGLTGRENGAQG